MKATEIIERMKELDEKYLEYRQNNNDDKAEEIKNQELKFLEQTCNKISIMFPHMDEYLRPAVELMSGCKCPRGLDGHCNDCDHFVCYTGDNEIFAFKVFTGYCAKEDDSGELTAGTQTGKKRRNL